MLASHRRNNRLSSQLRDRLKTTSMSLGLARLQMDVGLTEEARTTLASLQDEFQLLLHGVEEPMESQPFNSDAGRNHNRVFGDGRALNEELLAVHE